MIVAGALEVTCFGFLIYYLLVQKKVQDAMKSKLEKEDDERFGALSRAD